MNMEQKRPSWCPHRDCIFIRQSQELVCGGKLPKPMSHTVNGVRGINTHQFCMIEGPTSCYEVNANDLEWFRWVFDALDGKRTSWMSACICEKCGNPMTKVTEYMRDCGAIPSN